MSNLRLIDAHCHLNFSAYRDDAAEAMARSLESGIGLIVVGSQSTTSERAVRLADAQPEGVWSIIGLHPIHLFATKIDDPEEGGFTSRAEVFDPEFYRRLAAGSTKVVGIGECGLDYFHQPEDIAWDEFVATQVKAFRAQLDLARELGLPLMIHGRDSADGQHRAHDDIVAILAEYAAAGSPIRGDVHCFTGTWEEAERYLNLGFYVSFTGVVTYQQRAADRAAGIPSLMEVAKRVPLDRIIVETDAPYLAPVPHRGKRNEPAFVEDTAKAIAAARGLSAEDFAAAALANTRRLFGV